MHKKVIILFCSLVISLGLIAQGGDSKTNIELYPNPAVDFLVVHVANTNLNNVEIELRSMIGNKIRIQPESLGGNRYRIPLKDFATGYYFVIIKDEFARFKESYKILKR